jgi:hypothetical protein
MMASSDLDRVHQRLDEIRTFVGRMQAALDVNIALCKECRPKVMGNGQESLDNRLTRLEEARAVSKTFLLGMVSVAGAVGSLAAAALKLLGV